MDTRYTFIKDGTGRCGSGLAISILTDKLRVVKESSTFLSGMYLNLISRLGRQTPAIGFFVETVLISVLVRTGCLEHLNVKLKAQFYHSYPHILDVDRYSNTGTRGASTPSKRGFIFIPARSNNPAIDALIVVFYGTKEAPQVRIEPIQITISNDHSDSEANFFANYPLMLDAITGGGDWKVDINFRWIVEDPSNFRFKSADVSIGARKTQKQAYTTSAYKRTVESIDEISIEVGRRLHAARESAKFESAPYAS